MKLFSVGCCHRLSFAKYIKMEENGRKAGYGENHSGRVYLIS